MRKAKRRMRPLGLLQRCIRRFFAIGALLASVFCIYLQDRAVVPTTDNSHPLLNYFLTTKQKDVAVFYAIHLTDNDEASLKRVVQEQLKLIQDSQANKYNLTLYYDTYHSKSLSLESLCQDKTFSCIQTGSNVTYRDTLQRIWNYCGLHDSHTVVFLQSSPQFQTWTDRTPSQDDYWRRHLTRAVLSQDCIQQHDQCNVCGLFFSPFPQLSFPGNMWTSNCSYIRKLVQPKWYLSSVKHARDKEQALIQQKQLVTSLFDYSNLNAWEHWIASHPLLHPCDLSWTPQLDHWTKERPGKFKWELAPRKPFLSKWFGLSHAQQLHISIDEGLRTREYFLLAGNLIQWYSMYRQPPSEDSWVWSWYPDGDEWLQGVATYEEAAVQVFADGFSYPLEYEVPFVIFYNIYIPPYYLKGSERALAIIREQIEQVGQSYAALYPNKTAKTILYYTTVGGTIHHSWMASLCAMNQLNCQHVRHYTKGHEDRTLTKIKDFCQQHPEMSVVYIHTKGSYHSDDLGPEFAGQDQWRRHMTSAVTSEACLNPPNTSCNACGLLFQPIPGEHFPGNMWTAKCSYLSRLHYPAMLANVRTRLVALLGKMRNKDKLQANLFPVVPVTIGTDRFLMEQWIGSHPSLVPCDLSTTPKLYHWKAEDRNVSDEFVFDMAPRFAIGAAWDFKNYSDYNEDLNVIGNEDLRSKEVFLLPGHLFRWITEYNATPADDSWAWNWFPDGAEWRDGLSRHWTRVFDVMKQQRGVRKAQKNHAL